LFSRTKKRLVGQDASWNNLYSVAIAAISKRLDPLGWSFAFDHNNCFGIRRDSAYTNKTFPLALIPKKNKAKKRK
jgi:hypothetical protein